jgi:hypothetical protein
MEKGAEEDKRKLKKEAENEKKKWKIRKKILEPCPCTIFIRFFLKNNTYIKM